MEVIINGVVYVPKEKTALEVMKEKYESGEYLLIVKQLVKNNMLVVGDFWEKFKCKELDIKDDLDLINENKAKLISKKHADILDAYLKDNLSVRWKVSENADLWHCRSTLIEEYNENYIYEINPKEEYPIFKTTENGVYKFYSEDAYTVMLHIDKDLINEDFTAIKLSNDANTIPYNKERGLYHKQPCFLFFGKDVSIDFYDAKRDGFIIDKYKIKVYDRIEPITPDQLKVMLFIWDLYKQLRD